VPADFDLVEKAAVRPVKNSNEINALVPKTGGLGPAPVQEDLFHVEKQIEIDGVKMGVLDNDIPYLTESGLAQMCGIDRNVLNRLAVGCININNTYRRGFA
jgi:hypothetical protein